MCSRTIKFLFFSIANILCFNFAQSAQDLIPELTSCYNKLEVYMQKEIIDTASFCYKDEKEEERVKKIKVTQNKNENRKLSVSDRKIFKHYNIDGKWAETSEVCTTKDRELKLGIATFKSTVKLNLLNKQCEVIYFLDEGA